jgi:hypothetical protein
MTYEVVTRLPSGRERVQSYASDDPLAAGDVLRFGGRFWIVESIEEPPGDPASPRVLAKPARYRIRLRHPDDREELGALRRIRPGSPRLGHAFTTLEQGKSISWQVGGEQLARDENGEPFLDLLAERDYAEAEEGELGDHELEHALAVREEEDLPADADAAFTQAAAQGLDVELVALDPGEEPDWSESRRYIDSLVFEQIEDDLFEQCGVDVNSDRRETWLDTVKERLRSDLEAFRRDVEGQHDEVEEWDFRGGRIFVTVGSYEDEFDPDSGHGWMCRLLDSGALGIAGFARVRKHELELEIPD